MQAMTESQAPPPPTSGGEIRILVADDNPVNAELLREHLEAAGYVVDWASDGAHALAMASTGQYQAMLLDLHMPIYDGVEVLRRLHLLAGRPLRVIAITADRLASRREEITRLGIDGYLTKPVDLAGLDEILKRVLRKPDQ
jgi:CheY-like chemotaxis protein